MLGNGIIQLSSSEGSLPCVLVPKGAYPVFLFPRVTEIIVFVWTIGRLML